MKLKNAIYQSFWPVLRFNVRFPTLHIAVHCNFFSKHISLLLLGLSFLNHLETENGFESKKFSTWIRLPVHTWLIKASHIEKCIPILSLRWINQHWHKRPRMRYTLYLDTSFQAFATARGRATRVAPKRSSTPGTNEDWFKNNIFNKFRSKKQQIQLFKIRLCVRPSVRPPSVPSRVRF